MSERQHLEVTLRLIGEEGDFERMGRWLSDDRVLRFYGGIDDRVDAEQARREYDRDLLLSGSVRPCIIEWKGRAVGYLQFYPVEDFAEYGLEESEVLTWAMDLFIGEPEMWGQGIGTAAVSAVVEHIFGELRGERIVIDPHVDNPRAVRTYEKCGFEVVKLLERHELLDGQWRDAWLMEIRKPG